MKRKLITLLLAASLAACSGCGAASKEGGAVVKMPAVRFRGCL